MAELPPEGHIAMDVDSPPSNTSDTVKVERSSSPIQLSNVESFQHLANVEASTEDLPSFSTSNTNTSEIIAGEEASGQSQASEQWPENENSPRWPSGIDTAGIATPQQGPSKLHDLYDGVDIDSLNQEDLNRELEFYADEGLYTEEMQLDRELPGVSSSISTPGKARSLAYSTSNIPVDDASSLQMSSLSNPNYASHIPKMTPSRVLTTSSPLSLDSRSKQRPWSSVETGAEPLLTPPPSHTAPGMDLAIGMSSFHSFEGSALGSPRFPNQDIADEGDPFYKPQSRTSVLEGGICEPHFPSREEFSGYLGTIAAYNKDAMGPRGMAAHRVPSSEHHRTGESTNDSLHVRADVQMSSTSEDQTPHDGIGSRTFTPPKTPMVPMVAIPVSKTSDEEIDADRNMDDFGVDDQDGDYYEDEDYEDEDYRDEDEDDAHHAQTTGQAKSLPKTRKPRRRAARDPREYHTRKQQDEALKSTALPAPGSKMHGGVKKKNTKQASKRIQKVISNQQNLQNLIGYHQGSGSDGSANNEYVPVGAPVITATTKAAQIEEMIAKSGVDFRGYKPKTKAELTEKSKSFGLNNMKLVEGKWHPKGMSAKLHSYQMMAAAWMIEREVSRKGPHGGILADTMGLGKTIQTLTTIVRNPPPAGTPQHKTTTLVVVPPAIKCQWEIEIEEHASDTLSDVHMFEAKGNRPSKLSDLKRCDVVIATYDQVRNSIPWPHAETKELLQTSARRMKRDYGEVLIEWVNENSEDMGLLHKFNFGLLKIFLDEAHFIKNHNSRRSVAAAALQGHLRWALSGTPVLNSLEGENKIHLSRFKALLMVLEFYPYFRFLKHPEEPTREEFRKKYCLETEECAVQLAQVLGQFMQRRTGNDMFLGARILDLKTPIIATFEVDASTQERILYRCIEARLRQLINAELEEDDACKNLKLVMVQCMRLRQAVNHPLLIEDAVLLMFTPEELEHLRKRMQREEGCKELEIRLTVWIQRKKKGQDKIELPEFEQVRCSMCEDFAEDMQIISKTHCKHIFCQQCIESYIQDCEENDTAYPCPTCSIRFEEEDLKIYKPPNKTGKNQNPKASKKKQKGKDLYGFIPETFESAWLERVDAGEFMLMPGAKLTAVARQTRGWLADSPKDKIVIYVLYKQGMTLVGRMLEKMKIGFVYYSSDISSTKRDKAIANFRANPKAKVMIVGLQCGGLGLNLEIANRVIIVDLWWNTCAESQAFGRVHRFGQQKQTYLTRIVVKDTIDVRVLKMQANKDLQIQVAMKDTRAKELYLALFGRLIRDKNGSFRVTHDYDNGYDDDVGDQNFNMLELIDKA